MTWRRNDGSSGRCEVEVAVGDAETDPEAGEIAGNLTGRAHPRHNLKYECPSLIFQ